MRKIAAFIIFILMGMLSGAQAADLQIIAEDSAPFSYSEKNQPTGFAIDILLEAAEIAHIDIQRSDVMFWPWARGYAEIQENDNVILFPINKLEGRKPLFQWIGPMLMLNQKLLVRKANPIQVGDLAQDVKKYSLAVVRDGAAEQYLMSSGISTSDLYRVNSLPNAISMLNDGRIDGLFINDITTEKLIAQKGLNRNKFEYAHTLFSMPICYAASKNMDPNIVRRLQEAFDQLQANGRVDDIIQHHIQ